MPPKADDKKKTKASVSPPKSKGGEEKKKKEKEKEKEKKATESSAKKPKAADPAKKKSDGAAAESKKQSLGGESKGKKNHESKKSIGDETGAKIQELRAQLQEKEQAMANWENKLMTFNEDESVKLEKPRGSMSYAGQSVAHSASRSMINGHSHKESLDMQVARAAVENPPPISHRQQINNGVLIQPDQQEFQQVEAQLPLNEPPIQQKVLGDIEEINNISGNQGENVSKLFDQIQQLQNQNIELKKRVHKYKQKIEVIPELMQELQTVRETLLQVEMGYAVSKKKQQLQQDNAPQAGKPQPAQDEECSFGKVDIQGKNKNLTPEQLSKLVDQYEQKNYFLVQENIDLKDQICELKESVIKRTNYIEGLRSEVRIMVNDLRYLYQKLNHGQDINVNEPEITAKYLVTNIDHLIDEKTHIIKDQYDRSLNYEERVNALKNQIASLQLKIDRNQELTASHQAKLLTLEDQNRTLRTDMSAKQDSDRLLDSFRTHVRGLLINVRHKLDTISMDPAQAKSYPLTTFNNLTVDELIDQIGQLSQSAASNEKNLKSIADQLQQELANKAEEVAFLQRDFDNKVAQIRRDEEDKRTKLQNYMRGMEEIIDKNKFDKTYIQVDTEARIKVKDQESQQYKEDIDLLEAFLGEAFKKIKTLKFEKRYLEIDNKSANEILTRIETDVRPYLSMRDTQRRRLFKMLRKAAHSVIFISRLKKSVSVSVEQDTQVTRRALDRLYDNWSQNRQFWESSIKLDGKLHQKVSNLLGKLSLQQIQFADPVRRFAREDKLQLLDALKARLYDNASNSINRYPMQLADDRRIRTYDDQHYFKQRQAADDDLINRLRTTILDLESRLQEQEINSDQKVRYLKQEIEMKRHQIENMRKLVEYRDPLVSAAIQSRNGGGYTGSNLDKMKTNQY